MYRLLLPWLFFGTSLSAGESWVELFDGQSLDGWVQRGGQAEYRVENGEIVGTAVPNTPNSFLCTARDYGDFLLELEFKPDRTMNSGVQIRSQSLPDYEEGRVHGYQVEIDPSDRGWTGGIYDEGRRGWLDTLADSPRARYAFRPGEWNRFQVLAVGDSIRTWINGVPAADLSDGMTPSGFIALQVHGIGKDTSRPEVRWRGVRIQVLESAAERAEALGTMAADPSPSGEGPLWAADATVRKLAGGFKFVEGPSWGPDERLYFNDIPNERTHVWDPATGTVEIWRENTGRANGLWWTPGGRLLNCEGGSRQVTLWDEGSVKPVAETFDGKRFNSPNDLVLDGEGGIYFTDPRYGSGEDRELEKESVYYLPRKGELRLVTDDVIKPNGIILSPDGATLYVADPGATTIWAFPVTGPGEVGAKRKLAPIGSDGMAIDERGNVYCTFEDKISVWSPEGEFVAEMICPERPANCTFGGEGRRTLYITARTGLYALDMEVAGAY